MNSAGSLPIVFYVRPFTLDAFLPITSKYAQWALNFLFLPANYFMELGFFFVSGLYWWQHRNHYKEPDHTFLTAEMITLATVVVLLSFIRSNIIDINDLGIRAWLLGQFILLIWSVDVIYHWLEQEPPWLPSIYKSFINQPKLGRMLKIPVDIRNSDDNSGDIYNAFLVHISRRKYCRVPKQSQPGC